MAAQLYSIDIVIAFGCYFLILLAVGTLFHKKMTTDAAYVIGDRSLSFWVTAISAHASDMSSWLFMALPATIFLFGLEQAWIAIGLVIGMWANWQFIAPRLRILTEKTQSYTLSSFFEKHFKDSSGVIRPLSALIAIFYLTIYLSAGLIGMGLIIESLFDIDYTIALSVAIPVIVTYIFLGGFSAVARVDFFQGIFLCIVIVTVPLYALYLIPGGLEKVWQKAVEHGIPLSLCTECSPTKFISYFLLAVGWGLGYYGQPHIVTKFMGIDDPSNLRKGKYLGISWQIIALSFSILIGLVAIAVFPRGFADPQLVFVDIVSGLFPPFWVGFILCAVVAATMSTMDSQILVAASFLAEDVLSLFSKKEFSPQKKLLLSRISTIFIAVLAYTLALSKNSTIQETVAYAWSGLGSAFGPLTFAALYSKKCSKMAAIAGMLTGAIVSATWVYVDVYLLDIPLMPIIPGFFSALLVMAVITYFFPAKEDLLEEDLSQKDRTDG